MALTFDDGPWPGQTQRILRILLRFSVPATFFVIGEQASGPSRPGPPGGRGRDARGQSLVGPPELAAVPRPPKEPDHERDRAHQPGLNAIGVNAGLFRPPGGSYSTWMIHQAHQMGDRLVLWSVDPRDWQPGRTARQIVHIVLAHVRPGSIILLHDGGGDRSATITRSPGSSGASGRWTCGSHRSRTTPASDRSRLRRPTEGRGPRATGRRDFGTPACRPLSPGESHPRAPCGGDAGIRAPDWKAPCVRHPPSERRGAHHTTEADDHTPGTGTWRPERSPPCGSQPARPACAVPRRAARSVPSSSPGYRGVTRDPRTVSGATGPVWASSHGATGSPRGPPRRPSRSRGAARLPRGGDEPDRATGDRSHQERPPGVVRGLGRVLRPPVSVPR